MKKILLLSLLGAGLLFGYDSKTTFKRASDDIPKTINVNGIVVDADEWKNEIEVEIDLSNGKTIKGIVPSHTRIRENDKVRGMCSNFKNRKYRNCSLRRVNY